jgi:hypothetical protein
LLQKNVKLIVVENAARRLPEMTLPFIKKIKIKQNFYLT